jgi:hypothetical protein
MAAKQHPTVTLTREHRDAIYQEIVSVVHLGSDLHLYLADAECDARDRAELLDVVGRLSVCVRLLEQLGWKKRGDRDSYELEVDEDVARFMEHVDRHARGALEDDKEAALQPSDAYAAYGFTFTAAEWTEEFATRRALINTDLDGIDAARIALAAHREAVA